MFACMVAGTLAGVAQVGLKPMPGAMKPDFKKLNPASGLKNLFNPQHFAVEGVKNVVKVVAVGAIAAHGRSTPSSTSWPPWSARRRRICCRRSRE